LLLTLQDCSPLSFSLTDTHFLFGSLFSLPTTLTKIVMKVIEKEIVNNSCVMLTACEHGIFEAEKKWRKLVEESVREEGGNNNSSNNNDDYVVFLYNYVLLLILFGDELGIEKVR